jgi:hypothetical protein
LHVSLQCCEELLLLQDQLLQPCNLLLILLRTTAEGMLQRLLLVFLLLVLQLRLLLLVERTWRGRCATDRTDTGAPAVTGHNTAPHSPAAACAACILDSLTL